MTQLGKIAEKLRLADTKYLDKAFLEKLLGLFAPSYSISQICDTDMISPIKKGRYYINNLTQKIENSYKIADLYFEGQLYMFGGLSVYQEYGFSTQLADWNTVYNTQVSGKRIIGKTRFVFIKQREGFFYGRIERHFSEGVYWIMSPERAFIQTVVEGKRLPIPKNVNKQVLLKLAQDNMSKKNYQIIQKLCI